MFATQISEKLGNSLIFPALAPKIPSKCLRYPFQTFLYAQNSFRSQSALISKEHTFYQVTLEIPMDSFT